MACWTVVIFKNELSKLILTLFCQTAYDGGGLVPKSCPTLVIPWTVACQAPLSMGIPQARTLEWVDISFSRGFSQPRNQTQVSCIAGRFFTD